MNSISPFLVRQHETGDLDGPFIISAFDAAIPFLESVGSSEQWGSIPFSHREGWIEETMSQIKESEHSHVMSESEENCLHIFIVEREWPQQSVDIPGAHYRTAVDGRRFLSVGFAFIRENWFPSYITSHKGMQIQQAELRNSVYLEVMVTDSRVGSPCRGAGAALILAIRDYGRSREKRAFYLDGWAGNERKLIRFVFHHVFWQSANLTASAQIL